MMLPRFSAQVTIPADGSVSSSGLDLANLAVPTNVVFVFTGTDARGQSMDADSLGSF